MKKILSIMMISLIVLLTFSMVTSKTKAEPEELVALPAGAKNMDLSNPTVVLYDQPLTIPTHAKMVVGTPTRITDDANDWIGGTGLNYMGITSACNQTITHIGDLVIDGNQTFVIENCTFIQTGNIYVKDKATLIISHSKLSLNQSISWQYSIHADNDATIYVQNSTLTSSWVFRIIVAGDSYALFNCSNVRPFSYIVGQANSRVSILYTKADVVQGYDCSVITIKESTLWGVGSYSGEASVTVLDSTLDTANLFVHGSLVNVEELRNGLIGEFNTYHNITILEGWAGNITIFHSDIRLGIGLAFEASIANISQSTLSYMDALWDSCVYIYESTINVQATVRHNSTVTIDGSHVWMLNPWYDSLAIILDTIIDIFGCGYGNPTIFISNSTLGTLEVRDFYGKVFCDEVTIRNIHEIVTSQCYIYGNVTFLSHVDHWENSNVTRNFNVIVIDEKGYPLTDTELKLFNQDNAIIWSGLSNGHGKANFNLTFTDSNYTDTLRLEAVKGNLSGTKNVMFLSYTPIIMTLLPALRLPAAIDINPDPLNLKSEDKWITCYIELPDGYNVSDINVSTIMLNDTVPVDLGAPIEIGDCDNDSALELMVNFNWTKVAQYILSKNIIYGNVTLEVSGSLYNDITFTGTVTLLVSSLLGDVNVDGKVDIQDISIAALAFGSCPDHPRWNPLADINKDNMVDISDLALIARNFGKQF